MPSESDLAYVRTLLPEIQLIADPRTREGVEKIWVKAWKAAKWERIEDARFNPETPGFDLVGHVRSVTRAAVAMAQIMAEIHGLKFDRDLLVALGLLHDVSKLVEFEPGSNGGAVASEIDKKLAHGTYGGFWALEEGLSLDLVHLIMTHPVTSKTLPQLPEGLLFSHIDHADGDPMYFASGSAKRLMKR